MNIAKLRSRLLRGPLAPFIVDRPIRLLPSDGGGSVPGTGTAGVLIADRRLQDAVDYRQTLQDWFDLIDLGGSFIVIVPHAFLYERRLTLPSPWRNHQQRLYTPGMLLGEIEEALVPNSYRVRWAGDLDDRYDYQAPTDIEPTGDSSVAVVIERIAPPAWLLSEAGMEDQSRLPRTVDYMFEPPRTRIETDVLVKAERILIMELDHLGDFIMASAALRQMRRNFPQAFIDLAVGSWNVVMAEDLGIADRVIAFNAFPRNSSEEDANVESTLGLFRATFSDDYDLAIDLRTDTDTRTLLRAVRAPIKAGIGTRSRFPFLDIALPLDDTRNEVESAREILLTPSQFQIQSAGERSIFRLSSDSATVSRTDAIIWGPYLELTPGDYIFDFFLDLEEEARGGLLHLDIALDAGIRVAELFVSRPDRFHIPFRVEKVRATFEARIYPVDGYPTIGFAFYGGRLIKKSSDTVLHQSEYASLLIELIRLRILEGGQLHSVFTE